MAPCALWQRIAKGARRSTTGSGRFRSSGNDTSLRIGCPLWDRKQPSGLPPRHAVCAVRFGSAAWQSGATTAVGTSGGRASVGVWCRQQQPDSPKPSQRATASAISSRRTKIAAGMYSAIDTRRPHRCWASRAASSETAILRRSRSRCFAMLRNELSNGWNQVVWNLHNRLALLLKGSFVLRHCLFLRLPLVVFEDAFDSALIPIFRKFGPFSHRFLRLRRRYASSGLPASS